MSKRRPPIAKTLLRNSIEAMFAAIEIHNKPVIKYRYEIVVLLVINAWELLLKAYLYKFLKQVKLFDKDGKSKPFPECVNCVVSNLDKSYLVLKENLERLYEYRNKFAHFHIEDFDILIFSLLKKNLVLYKGFLERHFSIDITDESDLILLPIGFKKLYSPLDFLTSDSAISSTSADVRDFISTLIDSAQRLAGAGVEDTILIEFDMNVTNEKRIKNADIIAGISPSKGDGPSIVIEKIIKQPVLTDDESATPVKGVSFSVAPKTDAEEVAGWIAFKGKDPAFKPREAELWRMYATRASQKFSKKQLRELVVFSIKQRIPIFYWVQDFKKDELEKLFEKCFNEVSEHSIKTNILHMCAIIEKKCYTKMLSKFTESERERLAPRSKTFPQGGGLDFFNKTNIESTRKSLKIEDTKKFRAYLLSELNTITARLALEERDAYGKHNALYYDCYLYAMDEYE